MQATKTALDGAMFDTRERGWGGGEGRGEGLLYEKGLGFSSFRVQIKDSGLTWGVHALEEIIIKETLSFNFCFYA